MNKSTNQDVTNFKNLGEKGEILGYSFSVFTKAVTYKHCEESNLLKVRKKSLFNSKNVQRT